MFASIRAKLGAVFSGFLLLVAGSVVATFLAVRAQRADALVINLAGRQRMLTQRITKAALGIARDPSSDYRGELDMACGVFDGTLETLLDGGSVPYGDETVTLPPTRDPAIRSQLEEVIASWRQLDGSMEHLQVAEPDSMAFTQAVRDIEAVSPLIVQEMDQAVQLYEAAAETKLARLRLIQALFFGSAVVLLVAGYVVTQRTIVRPISALTAATDRMAEGDLATSVKVGPAASGEIHAPVRSFENRRHDLAAFLCRFHRTCVSDSSGRLLSFPPSTRLEARQLRRDSPS